MTDQHLRDSRYGQPVGRACTAGTRRGLARRGKEIELVLNRKLGLDRTLAARQEIGQPVIALRADDEVVYADAGYQGAPKRPEIADHDDLSRITWRVAARKGALKTMPEHDREEQSRQASVRAKVEHPFLIVKRDFGFTKTRYRGIDKNRNHLHMLFASANWLMRARAVALTG